MTRSTASRSSGGTSSISPVKTCDTTSAAASGRRARPACELNQSEASKAIAATMLMSVNAIAIAVGVDRAPPRPAGPLDHHPVRRRLDLAAERTQRRGHGLDPVRLLAPQLLGVADRRRPLGEAGDEGDKRQLVDGEWDFGAADLGGLEGCGADAEVG